MRKVTKRPQGGLVATYSTGHPPKNLPGSLFASSYGKLSLAAHGKEGEVDGVQAFGQVRVVSVLAKGHLQLPLGGG